jgi:hypothetical protein
MRSVCYFNVHGLCMSFSTYIGPTYACIVKNIFLFSVHIQTCMSVMQICSITLLNDSVFFPNHGLSPENIVVN